MSISALSTAGVGAATRVNPAHRPARPDTNDSPGNQHEGDQLASSSSEAGKPRQVKPSATHPLPVKQLTPETLMEIHTIGQE